MTIMTALRLHQIRTDGGTQPRAELNHELVGEYYGGLFCGDTFPPVVVFYDGADYWLADGFHRLEAHRRRGLVEIDTEIRQGTRRDAVLYACGANAIHGLRRTNADKRRAVETLLRDDEWRRWSDSEIARRCVVDHKTVASVRAELYPGNSQDSRMAARNGTTYEMNITSMGERPTLAEWRETDQAKRMFPYTCETCDDRFGQPVWHCPGCDHHYHVEDEECGNCHNYTRDGQYIGPDDDTWDAPMEIAQANDIALRPMKPKINRAGDIYQPQGFDACQTPPAAVEPLIAHLSEDWIVWEPACGEGMIVEALYKAGHDVVGSDILQGCNFFEHEPEHWDCLVTNPPYSIKYQWLERCYALGKPFALLLPVETLGAQRAQALFIEHGVQIILFDKRVNFKMPNVGWEGSSAQFPTAWFTWGLDLETQIVFAKLGAESTAGGKHDGNND